MLHGEAVAEAVRRVALGGAQNDLVDLRRDPRDHVAGGGNVVGEPLIGQCQRGGAAERLTAGEQFEEQHPGRVDVAARVDLSGADLLGRQIRGGAEDDAGRGDAGFGDGAHQPEIGHFHVAGVGDQDVLGFDVAVDEPCAVRGAEAAEGGDADRGDGVRGHGAAFAQQLAEAAAANQFHHQESDVVVDALVVHRDQSGMTQSGDGARLELETAQELRIADVPRIHHLDRHAPPQPQVGADVHRRHAAARDGGVDSVAALQDPAQERIVGSGHARESTVTTARSR